MTDIALLAWIDSYLSEHSYAPSVRDVARAIGVRSSSDAQKRLDGLRKQGLVSWLPAQPRTLHTTRGARGA